jgi:hypothetical protein
MEGTMSESVFLERVTDALVHLGIDLEEPVVDRNWGNSCFMRGPMAGYSINSLVKYWAEKNNKKVVWFGENYN